MASLSDAHTRRVFLKLTAAGAITLATAGAAFANPADVETLIQKMTGGKKPSEGRITLDLPTIAENGLVVPLGFDVQSPMTENDYVKSVHIFAESNPNVQVADYTFTPLCPKAAIQVRMRLAQTQRVTALAIMSNGDAYIARKEVKVTIGGCGG
ncbi:MAG: thiosulfate oxidation carrier protein SoxY [Proteobacteria bacterium]|nr:thiosulfate oxidation carrier protein SoxY [Pseudomonadota bacterium]